MVTRPVELEAKIDDFVRRLRKAITVEAVILFGSHARGTANEWSDIDIAVISPDFDATISCTLSRVPGDIDIAVISPDFDTMTPWQRQETVSRATFGRAYRIAPIGYASSEYRNTGLHSFLREIIRTGKVVYEAPR